MPASKDIKQAPTALQGTTQRLGTVTQNAIAEELRRKLTGTAAQLSSKQAELGADGEELRLSLDEAA
jgi:hypothetical protein